MKKGINIITKMGVVILGLLISGSVYAQATNNNEDLVYVDEEVKENLSTMPFSIELISKDRFEIYPKKVCNDFIVEFEAEGQEVSYIIYNVSGDVVMQKELKLTSAIIAIDIGDLKNGTYFIEIISEKKKDVQKIVKS